MAAKQDGAIGPKKLQVVANYENGETLGRLHDRRQKFYEGLSHFKTFGRGWTQRNKETLEAAHLWLVRLVWGPTAFARSRFDTIIIFHI